MVGVFSWNRLRGANFSARCRIGAYGKIESEPDWRISDEAVGLWLFFVFCSSVVGAGARAGRARISNRQRAIADRRKSLTPIFRPS